jgi:hypothetical protein
MRAALQRAQVILVVFALLAQLLMACGGHRQKALATALAGVDGARDGFVQWDDAYQSEVVLTAKSYEEGLALLATYREQREHVVTAFELAYQALATAALSDEDTTFEVAMGRIEHLYNVMKVLMGDDAPKDLPTN